MEQSLKENCAGWHVVLVFELRGFHKDKACMVMRGFQKAPKALVNKGRHRRHEIFLTAQQSHAKVQMILS